MAEGSSDSNEIIPSLSNIPNFRTLVLKVTRDKDICLKWCMSHKLISTTRSCAQCMSKMKWTPCLKLGDGYIWRCSKKECAKTVSIRAGSWFEGSRLSVTQILDLTYLWCYKEPISRTMQECDIGSYETAVDWFNYCREVCAVHLNYLKEKLGGPGVIVEIDESCLGKCKSEQGHARNQKWVFGAMERGSNKCRLHVVECPGSETLLPLLEEWIIPGTTVVSDLWKAYDCLDHHGYTNLRVNHSINFVDPDSGASVQVIENVWSCVKRDIRIRKGGTSKHLLNSDLIEYMWRQRYHTHPFQFFIDHVRQVYSV